MPASPQGTDRPATAGQRIALRIEHDTPCPDCGYNLRGLRLDGRCPECGRPAIDTFARPVRTADGQVVEDMLDRPAVVLFALSAFAALARLYPLVPAGFTRAFGIAAVLGLVVMLAPSLLRVLRERREVKQYRASRPLRDRVRTWQVLCTVGILGGIGLATLMPQPLPFLALYGVAILALIAAQWLAAQAALEILRRSGQGAGRRKQAPVLLSVFAGIVAASAVAPLPLTEGLAILLPAGVLGAVLWLATQLALKNELRRAQGSVVSIR